MWQIVLQNMQSLLKYRNAKSTQGFQNRAQSKFDTYGCTVSEEVTNIKDIIHNSTLGILRINSSKVAVLLSDM